MNKTEIEFAAFKEKLEASNKSSKERFDSIETEIQSLRRKNDENNGTILSGLQSQSIRNELVAFEERIRRLEALNQATDTQVILGFQQIYAPKKNTKV